MILVCLAAAAFCLGYYAVIVRYAGKTSNFIKIWAAAGIFFVCMAGMIWGKENGRILGESAAFETAETVFWGLVTAGCLLFVIVESFIFHAMRSKPDSGLEYVIVLGAHVKGEIPSRALRKRLERARQYLEENPQTRAVLSGGKGRGEDITEAEAMRRYLEKHGIHPKRLFLEKNSTSTKENIEFSMKIIQNFDAPIGIVTNDFHIFRSVAIGKKMGCTHIQGISAPGDAVLELNYLVRECFAVIKEKLRGNI